MNPDKYVIDFTIPRGATGSTGETGPIGPTGPTGPAANISYGYKTSFYNTTQHTVNGTFLANSAPTQVELPGGIYKLNIAYTDNGIKLQYNGLYEVKYGILIQVPSATEQNPVTVTVSTRLNGLTPSTDTSLSIELKDNNYHLLTNSIFTGYVFSSSTPNTVEMVIFADQATNYNYTSAYLSVNLISENFS